MAISNLFIIGAGFTKAICDNAPLNKDFLEKVVGPEPDNSPLGRIWSEYGLSDIEILLTRFDLDLHNETGCFTENDRKDINEQIAKYFSRFRFQIDAKFLDKVRWLLPFIHILSDNDVIISLNYDCFLEGFLDYYEVWSPRGGYHIIKNMNDDSLPENQRNIQILKIHGSENFREASFFKKPESMYVDVEINSTLFPRSGKNQQLWGGLDSSPYVIAPSFIKQFALELQYLLLDAIQFAKIATNIIIIGCGLRPEDSHLQLVLNGFLKDPLWKKKRIFIVSPDACKKKKEIEQFWGRKIFNQENLIIWNSVFDENAILWLSEKLRN
ncbi:SIR2 family protein [Atribacter laminatus]|uniref:SIR2-like domain-containing protein n=1 Tax=Atribacter laminatus TaxID=2847778 RepID=A0A7T1AJ55_ATRLM|nr:SIR2 family protein [Atribacter laminatus]QPM66876.1 hypothetical protein RT761_00062 [Atribacter laminatus]